MTIPCRGCEDRRKLLSAALDAGRSGDPDACRDRLRAMATSIMDDLKKLALAKLRPVARPVPEDE